MSIIIFIIIIIITEVKFQNFHVQDVILWDLTFIFSGFLEKCSLVLL